MNKVLQTRARTSISIPNTSTYTSSHIHVLVLEKKYVYFTRIFLQKNILPFCVDILRIIPSTQLLPKINTQLSAGSTYKNRTSSPPSILQHNPKEALFGETVDVR